MKLYFLIQVCCFIAICCGVFSFLSCTQKKNVQSKEVFATVGVAEFSTFIDAKGTQLLDVRTKSEYDEGHIKGATLIDWKDGETAFLDAAEKQLSKTSPVAVYCRSGRRSAAAAMALANRGFRVTNLDGGIMQWETEGMPIDK